MTDDAVYTLQIDVTEDVIDGNGHVNNVVYVRWMQDAAVAHFRSKVTQAQMTQWSCTWVARSHFIEYLSPAFCGDQLLLETWIADWRRVRSMRRYRITRASDGAVIARGETDWVLIDTETGKPRRIPQEILGCFRATDGPFQ